MFGDEDERHATIAPFHSVQTTNATLAPELALYQHHLNISIDVYNLLDRAYGWNVSNAARFVSKGEGMGW